MSCVRIHRVGSSRIWRTISAGRAGRVGYWEEEDDDDDSVCESEGEDEGSLLEEAEDDAVG